MTPACRSGGTTLGHVHLQVSDLAAAEAFYAGALGFDVMVRGYPGALFVAAGGYHHHLGLNTWASAGGPPADPAARGLRDFAVRLSGAAEREPSPPPLRRRLRGPRGARRRRDGPVRHRRAADLDPAR